MSWLSGEEVPVVRACGATYVQTGSWFCSYSPLHYFTRPRGTVAVTDTPQRLSTDPGAYQSQAQPFIFGFLRLLKKKFKIL